MANNNFIAANNLFGWGQSFNATGKFPMLAKRVWQTYDDMIAFVSDTSDVCPAGVILTVVNDTNADNNGAYFVASCPTLADPTIPVVVEKIGSDVPSAMEATNYSAALALISSEELPLGTLIKVANEETVGEGETAKKYNAGFYVVNGVGENAALLYLSTSSGTDITIDTVVTDVETLKTDVDAVESNVAELTTTVSGLETTVGNAESGLVKDVADLQTAVGALPETFVTDVKDASGNSLVVDGVATLGDYATKAELEEAIGNVDFSALESAIDKKADAESVYTKDAANAAFAAKSIEETVAANVTAVEELRSAVQGGVHFKGVYHELPTLSYTDGTNEITGTWHNESGEESTGIFHEGDLIIVDNGTSPEDVEEPTKEYILVCSDSQPLWVFVGNCAVSDQKIAELEKEFDEHVAGVVTMLEPYAKTADVVAKTIYEQHVADADLRMDGIDAAILAVPVKSVTTGDVLKLSDAGALSVDVSTINAAIDNKVDKIENHALVATDLITKLEGLATINSVGENLSIVDNELQVDLSNLVVKVDGKGLSTNDFTNELKTKLEGIAAGAEVNYVKSVGANLSVSDAGELTVDLSALATSEALTSGLAAKLDASAKVNGVSFANGEAVIDASDIALGSAIEPSVTNGGSYTADNTVQEVLASLSGRIDTLDPTITGEFGVSKVDGGNGIAISGTTTNPQISVKVSTSANNMLTVDDSGIYVQDMRSYWEAI